MRSDPKAQTALDNWLDAATRGLCDGARERIAEEIASHYDEAFETAMREGMSATEAASNAVRSLGEPRSARKRWREECLTRREARIVSKLVRYHRKHTNQYGSAPSFLRRVALASAGAVAMVPVLAARLITEQFSETPLALTVVILLFVSCPVLFGLAWWFGMHLGQRLHLVDEPPIWRTIQLQGFLSVASLTITFPMMWSYLLWPPSYSNPISTYILLIVALSNLLLPVVVIETMRTFRLARKLRRLGYDQPPSAMV